MNEKMVEYAHIILLTLGRHDALFATSELKPDGELSPHGWLGSFWVSWLLSQPKDMKVR